MTLEKLPTFKYYLTIGGTDYEITEAPEGWEDTEVSWKKDTSKYWGNTQEFSFPFKFVLEGARYLRRMLYTHGVDGESRIKVMKLNPSTESYYLEFEGDIDYSPAKDELTGVEVNLMNDGTTAKLKAIESTEFEFSFDENAINVRVPGVDIVEYAKNIIGGSNIFVKPFIFPTMVSDDYTPLNNYDVFDQEQDSQDSYNFTTYPNKWFTPNNNVQLRIHGYIQGVIRNWLVSGMKAYWNVLLCDSSTPNGGARRLIYSTVNEPAKVLVDINVNIDIYVDAVAGRNYFLVLECFKAGGIFGANTLLFQIDESLLSIDHAVTTEPAIVKCYRPINLMEKLAEKAEATAQSSLLSSVNDVITSGEAIRGLPEALLKTSFANFWKSVDAQYCCGLGIDNTARNIRIEEREFFFRAPYVLANLGEVKDLVVEPYTQLLASDIKVGYQDNSYEVPQGRFEFNSEQRFTTTSRRVNRTLEITSPYRADQFGIEELRVMQLSGNTDNASETDNKWDNSVFWLRIKAEPDEFGIYDVETAEDYDNVDGVVSRTSTYNIGLSPKSMLLRHNKFICSSFFGVNENGNIAFASSAKNADLVYTKGSTRVAEKDPIYIADINSQGRVFLPFQCTFTAKYPKSLQGLIKNSPYGCVQFSWQGKSFKGFILECSVDLAKDTEQEFTLLLTPDNNLSNFL